MIIIDTKINHTNGIVHRMCVGHFCNLSPSKRLFQGRQPAANTANTAV